jgi:hypothetical protein
MKNVFLFFFAFCCFLTFSQNKKTDRILEEGQFLYRLERGSWFGTDDFIARFTTKKDSVGGYLSYETLDNKVNTIFFSRFEPNVILVRYQFDTLLKPKPISIDTLNRNASELEKSLMILRQDALKRASENQDNFFTFYENTSLNFIPIIKGNKGKVFVLTGTNQSGYVIIGNDYVLNYDDKNNFKDKSKIHNSMLRFAYRSEDENIPLEATFHTHTISTYITSTDICTLLLYKDFVEWKQHIVVSDKEVSIFNMENETLVTMKRKDWEKLNGVKK